MTNTIDSNPGQKPPMTWKPLLCLAAHEVFAKMVGVKMTVCPEPAGAGKNAEYTAVIGIAGPITGIFTLRCTGKAAMQIASRMLGLPPEEAGLEMFDALGEICNMVAGNFKSKLGDQGNSSMLSIPQVIKGSNYTLRMMADEAVVESVQQFGEELIQFKINFQTSAKSSILHGRTQPNWEVSISCLNEQPQKQ